MRVKPPRAAWFSPFPDPHAFSPVAGGSQCAVVGCWGWADDYRHLGFSTRPVGVVPPLLVRDRRKY